MRTAREFRQELVKSPSLVFEQIPGEQVKWQRPVCYSYTLQVSLWSSILSQFARYFTIYDSCNQREVRFTFTLWLIANSPYLILPVNKLIHLVEFPGIEDR
jgi:hypothetical protein